MKVKTYVPLLGLLGMLGGVARAEITSIGTTWAGPGGPDDIYQTATTGGPINLRSAYADTYSVTHVDYSSRYEPPTVSYTNHYASGTAAVSANTAYGAIHASASAQSDPYFFGYYVNGDPTDPPYGPTYYYYRGMYTQATFHGLWNDRWHLSGLPGSCASGGCQVTVTGHFKFEAGVGADPGAALFSSSPSPYAGGYAGDFSFLMNDGTAYKTPYNASQGFLFSKNMGSTPSFISGTSYGYAYSTHDLGDSAGDHYLPWSITYQIFGDRDYYGNFLDTQTINVYSEMELRVYNAAFVNASDTGAIDSIVLPAGVSLTSDSGEVVSRLDGSFGYVAAVPEPETYALFMAGLGLLAAVSRGRRSGG